VVNQVVRLDHGISTLSLRRVAQEVGVSHATLQHHFGTKEQLIDEIVDHLLNRTLVPPEPGDEPDAVPDGETRLREMWGQWTSPIGMRDIRLFLEIAGQSLFEDSGYRTIMKRSMETGVSIMAGASIAQGCPPQDAPAIATLLIGQLRGLISDLLITGDYERVNAAFELVCDNTRWRIAAWARDRVGSGSIGALRGAVVADRKMECQPASTAWLIAAPNWSAPLLAWRAAGPTNSLPRPWPANSLNSRTRVWSPSAVRS
jgi:AcrR family transcriptional regulator